MRGKGRFCWVMMLIIFVVPFFVSLSASSKELTKTQLVGMYMNFLQKEGYSPILFPGGDVILFKYEGGNFVIPVKEIVRDPQFFMVLFPNFWKIKNATEEERALVSASYVNRTSKVVKIYLENGNAQASAEIFLSSPEEFKLVFKEVLGAIQNGVVKFVRSMRGERI